MGGSDWIRAARREKKKEEIGGDGHRDLCPSEGTGTSGTGDPAGPAASVATAEAESAARARVAGGSLSRPPLSSNHRYFLIFWSSSSWMCFSLLRGAISPFATSFCVYQTSERCMLTILAIQ